MNRDQARALIAQTFTSAFDKARFHTFVVNLVNRIDETKAQSWNGQYIKDAFKYHVHRYERLGTYTSPDNEKLDVLVVHLTKESKLERGRTAIRNFVADHLKARDEKEAALVAFVSPTEKQWRFSYVKMEYSAVEKESGKIGVETRLTPARRFSYLVGEGESCHTAQTRFLGLLQDTSNDPKLADIEESFSVEAVTAEFFKKYAQLFGDFQITLEKIVESDRHVRDEFKAKGVNIVDFAKKLMGQIVFLYFIQKKGWLGVAKGHNWGSGPHDFLRRLAKGEHGPYANFFNEILEPLFYDTLATDRGHQAWCSRFNCRIPFLNGGLFEPISDYDWRETDITLPNKLFTNSEHVEEGITGTGVLDVFDRYNFTVNEAEPLEKEVAIDPEMLGKVFENLIEENRRKGLGAYYTPREIVHYMCQESLINYLDTALNKDKETVPRAQVDTFVRLGEQISHYEAVDAKYAVKMPKSIEKNARQIDEKLADIAICDPAVGSGAFPVGMMTEIVRARSSLTSYFNDVHERTPYHFKRHAIQNCLYGVDIDAGAVEIAKLRLWLSLVVDEEDVQQIKPLPNLDYKIVVGNSLLGVEKNLFNQEKFNRLEELKPKFFDESDRKKKAKFKRQIDDLIHALTNGREDFDFEIYFSEVFHAKQGFDVVIANPPYVRHETISKMAPILRQRFTVAASRADLLIFFYEEGVNLLRTGGVLTLITSNKFYRAGYGSKLRPFLTDKLQIETLIDFGDSPVFEAIAYASILIGTKGEASGEHQIRACTWRPENDFSSLPQTLAREGIGLAQSQLAPDGWRLESPAAINLLEKLRKTGTPLGEYVDGKFYYGIKTGLNEAFVLTREQRDQLIAEDRKSAKLIKPFLRGRDVKRWVVHHQELYLIVFPHGFHSELKNYPAILRHLTRFQAQLKDRGQCKTSRGNKEGGQHHWLELDNNPKPEYLDLFDGPKLVYPDIAKRLSFAFDLGGLYSTNTTYFIPGSDLSLCAHLNSKPVEWFYRNVSNLIRGGFVRAFSNYIRQIPIPPATATDKAKLTKLAERAAKAATAGDAAAVARIEREIDEVIYRLFDLTAAEIAQIETSLASTRSGSSDDDDGDEDA